MTQLEAFIKFQYDIPAKRRRNIKTSGICQSRPKGLLGQRLPSNKPRFFGVGRGLTKGPKTGRDINNLPFSGVNPVINRPNSAFSQHINVPNEQHTPLHVVESLTG